MKNLLKGVILIAGCGLLVACFNSQDDGREANVNNQNPPPLEQNNVNEKNEINGTNEREENDIDPGTNNETKENEIDSEANNEQELNEENAKINNADAKAKDDDVVIKNDGFKIFEPAPDSEISENITVRGLSSAADGVVNYEFEDGHFIMDEGSVTADESDNAWKEFEITVDIDGAINGSARVILFETSDTDGSKINELIIPVEINK